MKQYSLGRRKATLSGHVSSGDPAPRESDAATLVHLAVADGHRLVQSLHRAFDDLIADEAVAEEAPRVLGAWGVAVWAEASSD